MRARPDRKPLRMLALISQLGICMLTAIFFCVVIGYYISRLTGILWLFPLILVIGVLAGFRSCYFIISRFVNLKEKASEVDFSKIPNEVKYDSVSPGFMDDFYDDDRDETDGLDL